MLGADLQRGAVGSGWPFRATSKLHSNEAVLSPPLLF